MQLVYFISYYSCRFRLIPTVLCPTVPAQYASEGGSGDTVTGSRQQVLEILQCDSEEIVIVLGGVSAGHCEKKVLRTYV